MKARNALLMLLVGALAAGVLYIAFRPKPTVVEVATVTRGSFLAIVEQDGKTRVRSRYLVSSPLGGRILRIDLKPGDMIKAGQPLAILLPSLPPLLEARTRQELQERIGASEASLQEAAARLERAQAQSDQSRRDVDRVRTLQGRGAATTQQLEREELILRLAERDRAAAEMRRHATEHELDQAKALLRRYEQPDTTESWTISAPVDGRILRVIQESEAPVAAGASLVEIGDPRDLEIIADVLTSEAVEIKAGADVVIDRWGGPGALTGRVRLVEPAAFTKISALGIEEQRVWVVIDIVSPREQWIGLGDNFRVNVRITVANLPDAIIAPSGALFRRGDEWACFAVEDGVARERPIVIRRRSGRLAAIDKGLGAGEQIVVFPPASLRDGMRVRTR
ncbi:efflux RND transporter periplasmic adaptor subunit [Roseiarcaceae bacterium H3SJ34-1]|uniref:efflux RND transporter periplasmic adaptor subunit n=1 Tax=Terripilifer ovatus TaxID=3032367 RepID=UPI003AB94B1E|nr:efflux RND transporter periplasmic adaptor subunit [Roseiarcaceae bacterium H3SJ34-1]